MLSSWLILEAEKLAILRWDRPLRVYTYVNPKRVLSSHPGYCFVRANWEKVGYTRGGLVILAKEIV